MKDKSTYRIVKSCGERNNDTGKSYFHAKLIIYGLTNKVSPKRVVSWLLNTAKDIKKNHKKISKIIYTAKLMK